MKKLLLASFALFGCNVDHKTPLEPEGPPPAFDWRLYETTEARKPTEVRIETDTGPYEIRRRACDPCYRGYAGELYAAPRSSIGEE